MLAVQLPHGHRTWPPFFRRGRRLQSAERRPMRSTPPLTAPAGMYPRLIIPVARTQAIVDEVSPSSENGSFDFPKMLRLLADAIRPPDVDVRRRLSSLLCSVTELQLPCRWLVSARSWRGADLRRYHVRWLLPDVGWA